LKALLRIKVGLICGEEEYKSFRKQQKILRFFDPRIKNLSENFSPIVEKNLKILKVLLKQK
jgi:hypothetical protein